MLFSPFVQILLRLALAVALLAAVQWGVVDFFRIIEEADDGALIRSDAIVVFSGDPARMVRGFDLLSKGVAPMLFTAGVDNLDDIERLKQANPSLALCCVEGEQTSRTTHEDAEAIAAWFKVRSIKSAIVVTTNIHMPRAVAELQGQVQNIDLQFSGVMSGLYDSRCWVTDLSIRHRLKTEWLKYVTTRMHNLVGWPRATLTSR